MYQPTTINLGKVIRSDVKCSKTGTYGTPLTYGSTWTEWYNLNELSDYGDSEESFELKKEGLEICNFPTALQGSVAKLYRRISNL